MPGAGAGAGSGPSKATRKDVTDGVFLYRTVEKREGGGTQVVYEVECARFNRVEFTLDFSKSVNVEVGVADGAALERTDAVTALSSTVPPFRRQRLGSACTRDASKRTSLITSWTWSLLEPDEDAVRELVRRNRSDLAAEIEAAERYGFGDDSASVEEIERRCKMYGVPFLDADFPPTDRTLYGADVASGAAVVWRRPAEFASGGAPDVFVGGIEPGDIRQGALADCWFLCALASLAEFPHLVRRLYLEESRRLSAHGVYKVRLCKNGQWQTYVVDDYFPCYPGGGPVYSRAHGDELWVLLLEKAYAKAHGHYAAIRMGFAFEAMIDLTGAPYKTVRLQEEDGCPGAAPARLWQSLLRWDAQGYIMSASTPGEDTLTETGDRPAAEEGTGLVQGHAYTLLCAREAGGQRLVLMRNPWGNFEWRGAWSDASPLWTDEIKEAVGFECDEHDGKFWMSFDDLRRHFFSVNVCMVRHRAGGAPPWVEQRRKASFTYDPDAGAGATVACSALFVLSVAEPARLFLSVHQEDARCAGARPYLDIGVTVLRIRSDYTYELVAGTGCAAERQNQTDEVLVGEGQYLLVPTTTGCKFRRGLLDAQRAAAGAAPADLWAPGRRGREFSAAACHALNEVFRRLDVDLDGVLNREELEGFALRAEGEGLREAVFPWLLETFDSTDGGLTPDGFRDCYAFIWAAAGGDDEVVWRDLLYHGYSRRLELLYSRSVMLAVHADKAFELHAQPFDAEAYEEAMELPIKAYGECKHYADHGLKLYIRRAGHSGVSIAAENLRDSDIEFALDMSGSANVTTHQQSLDAPVVLPSRETKVLHHVMPDGAGPWSWKYRPAAITDLGGARGDAAAAP